MTSLNDNQMIDRIIPSLKAGSKNQALYVVAEYAGKYSGLGEDEIKDILLSQEKFGAGSGIGDGVAVLHITSERVKAPFTLFARASQKVPYDSVDGEPVDLFFLVMSPQEDGAQHLQRLSRISRLGRDRVLCQKLRAADTVDGLKALMFDCQSHRAAA